MLRIVRHGGKMRLPPLNPVVFVLLLAANGLLAWHALHGKRSLNYQAQVRERLVVAQEAYADTQTRRQELERKVARLREETLGLDTLDEEARRQLGFIAPDEVLALPGEQQ